MAVLFLGFALPSTAQVLVTRQNVYHDVSPPLRDLVKTGQPAEPGPREAEPLRVIPLHEGFKPPETPDPVLQRTAPGVPEPLAPTVINNFDGLGEGVPAGFSPCCAPPDTNGAVGLTQYVQWVNLSFAVFDKTTTSITLGPANGNTLWSGFGGDCETSNDGDPIVVYDKLADRWVFTQFVVHGGFGPFLQCVAVSTTSDATGTFNRYSFTYSNFDDYPKLGVWPDAYYVTFNMFGPNSFVGADACAYDRNAMLNGQPATQICFQQGSSVGSLLPSDVDGHTLPPAGSPNFMMTFDTNSLSLFKFHVDFATPGNSTFTGPTSISVAPFTPLCNGGRNCVPQSGTGTQLDSLADRLMYRLAYRNFGDHESLVVNHAVAVNSSSGVRWYEIQNPNGTPAVAQQSTFAPDNNFRWMGSIAMDVSGDIALGYSVSSSSTFPAIAFAGRTSGDPTSTLGAETTLITGTGSQTNGLTRWGDYSAMQVDPSDDCTFWYTTEYLKTTGSFNWNTRIASFKFPGCGQPDLTIAKSHTGNFTQGQKGASYTITVTNAGGKDTSGTVTVVDALPAKLTAKAISGTGWTCTLGTLTCTRSNALASNTSYPVITLTVDVAGDAPGTVTNSVTVSGGGETNTANDTATDPTTIIQNGPDLTIAKSHTGPFVQGQMGTYTISITNVGLSATDGTTVTVTDSLPTGLTANTATGTGWTCVVSAAISCTRSDALASNGSYPPITVTVNVAKNAPASVINTAPVAGGGDTNNLNNSASDPTTIVPPPPDLTITKSHSGNFNQGQTFGASYTITVKNVGSSPTNSQVTVTDTLPTGLTSIFMSGFGWNCNSSTLTCTRNDVLASGASYQPIGLSVSVASDAPPSVINTATVSGGGDITPGNNTATDPTTINQVPDLTISKSHTPDPFIVGQTGTYTLVVSNAGHAPTSGIVNVSDFLPNGLSATSITGSGWSCSAPPTTSVNCTRSDALAAGSNYPSIVITVSVLGGGPSVVNFANVSGGGEFNTANDNASDPTNITAPVLAITKTHTGDFTVGEPGIYKITVSNTGKIATIGTVTVSDSLPFGLSLIGASGAGWLCSTPPATSITCTRSDSLASNAGYPVITLTAAIGSTSSTVTNFASVTGGGDSQFHSAADTANVNTPVLAITKSHTGNFTIGQPGIYTITVSNTGKIPTVGTVTVSDFLPFGMTATSVTGAGWNCPGLPTTFLTCTRSDVLHANQSYPALSVTVSVNGNGPSTTNFASVAGGGNSTATASDFTIINGPTLAITKSHTGNFTVGQSGTYTISVSNTGNSATSGTVTVNDFLPFGMTATAVNAPGWNCPGLPTTFFSCFRSDALAAGNSYPAINMTVTVNSGGPSVTNFANVSGGGDSQFHSASDPTNINAPSLAITKTHTGNFTLGQPGAYIITVSNTGSAATTGTVAINDFLPFGLTATAINAPGWGCAAPPTTFVNCSRSDALASGSSYPVINLTVSVNGGAPAVTNFVSVNGGGDSQFHSASDPTNINAPNLAITKSHTGNFTAGQTGTYTITVSNTGKLATSGTVTVTDPLPLGFSATATTGAGWSCSGTTSVTCTRSNTLAPGGSYPAITLTVSVNGGGPGVTNTASVTGGGDPVVHSANDFTTVIATTLGITKTHSGDFTVGQPGIYTITVTNTGTLPTFGTVTVTDSLPQGLTATATSGTGWNCSGITFVSCTRSDSIAAGNSYPPITVIVSVNGGGPSVTNSASVTGGGDSVVHQANDPTNILSTTLGITKIHNGDFIVGQTGSYTITVSNTGQVATGGTVTVTDFLPFGLNLVSVTGTGWNCSGSFFVNCTRSDSLAAGSSYPAITLTANITGNNFSSTISNTAGVTGGGDSQFRVASDTTTIRTPSLAISKSHTGNFTVGQSGSYTIAVNNAGSVATIGTVTVTDFLPAGLTAIAVNASGWSCSQVPTTFMSCSRTDSLAASAGYPPITLIVSVDPSAPAVVVNQASVSGGADAFNHTTTDIANINLPDLAITKSHTGDFTVGLPGIYTITVSSAGAIPTAGGTVTVNDFIPGGLTAVSASGTDWNCTLFFGTPGQVTCTRSAGVLAQGNSYPPISVTVSVAPDAPSTVTNVANVTGIGDADFTNNVAFDNTKITGLRFVPVTPCRVADTRNPNGPFGGPLLGAGTTRAFSIPDSSCGIPASAQAYSVNVTVVPKAKLAFLTMFPCGQDLPLTSTLNSDGRVKAAAAIVPAGTNGGACAFTTDDTDFILDIDGYFVPASNASALAFYPLSPCRLVDTRNAAGPLGGPSLVGNATRTLPLLSSSCNVPNTAQAYSLNYTSVPKGKLGFLTTWPAGQTQPLVSTLNAPTGKVTANAAIVPAGTNGAVNVFVTDSSDLVIDINGYFAPPGQGGLSFFPVTPCRALDSRNPPGTPPFTGTRDINIGTSGCGTPASAQALVLNATVVPPGPLDFLTLWPQGATQPLVSTLNAGDGAITSNLAIVPTTNGSVSAFVPQASHLVLDISGFFAP